MKTFSKASVPTYALFSAICQLETVDETRRFLRDLLTEDEIEEFSRRWQAARLLSEGVLYSEIAALTGLSSTTIARVSKWLTKGTGGYRLMIDRVNSHHHHSRIHGNDSR